MPELTGRSFATSASSPGPGPDPSRRGAYLPAELDGVTGVSVGQSIESKGEPDRTGTFVPGSLWGYYIGPNDIAGPLHVWSDPGSSGSLLTTLEGGDALLIVQRRAYSSPITPDAQVSLQVLVRGHLGWVWLRRDNVAARRFRPLL